MGRADLLSVGLDAMDELLTGELEDAINIIEWGIWSRGGIPTGKPNTSPTPNISDDDALLIDRQVARLGRKTKNVIMQIYINGRGVSELSRITRMSPARITKHRDQGLNRIYGGLKEIVEILK